MSFAGRRLQNLHLGTSIIESIYCLRYSPEILWRGLVNVSSFE